MNPRVLLVSGRYPPQFCGIGDYTNFLAQALSQSGVAITVVTKNSDVANSLIPVESVHGSWKLTGSLNLKKVMAKINPDIVHVQWETYSFEQSWVFPIIMAKSSAPLCVTLHELFFRNWFHRKRDLLWLTRARHLIVNDQLSLQKLNEIQDLKQISRSVVGVGSNIPIADSKLSPSGENIVISFFGFTNMVKDLDTVLNALSLIKNRAWIFRLIGAIDPESQNRIERKCRELGIGNRIEFHIQKDHAEVSRLLSESHFCVLPFSDGASPRRGSLQACLAHGKAVITTRPKVNESSFKHLENIWLLQDFNAEATRLAIEELILQPHKRETIGKGALDLSREFSWKQIAQRHLPIYSEI